MAPDTSCQNRPEFLHASCRNTFDHCVSFTVRPMATPPSRASNGPDYVQSMYRHIHLHTHVSMSSTYVLLSQLLPVYPPNTTALRWSIFVKVWLSSGGGLSPVVLWTAHTPAGTVTEQKYVSLSGPLYHVESSINTIPYMAVVMCGCGHIMHLIHTQ